MKITPTYSLSPEKYFIILTTNYFMNRKKVNILFLFLFFANIILLIRHHIQGKIIIQNLLAIVIIILIPLIYLIRFYIFCRNIKNKVFFLPRYIEYNDENFSVVIKNIKNTFSYSDIINFQERKNYSLLYITKKEFIYVPKKEETMDFLKKIQYYKKRK